MKHYKKTLNSGLLYQNNKAEKSHLGGMAINKNMIHQDEIDISQPWALVSCWCSYTLNSAFRFKSQKSLSSSSVKMPQGKSFNRSIGNVFANIPTTIFLALWTSITFQKFPVAVLSWIPASRILSNSGELRKYKFSQICSWNFTIVRDLLGFLILRNTPLTFCDSVFLFLGSILVSWFLSSMKFVNSIYWFAVKLCRCSYLFCF